MSENKCPKCGSEILRRGEGDYYNEYVCMSRGKGGILAYQSPGCELSEAIGDVDRLESELSVAQEDNAELESWRQLQVVAGVNAADECRVLDSVIRHEKDDVAKLRGAIQGLLIVTDDERELAVAAGYNFHARDTLTEVARRALAATLPDPVAVERRRLEHLITSDSLRWQSHYNDGVVDDWPEHNAALDALIGHTRQLLAFEQAQKGDESNVK